MSKSKLQRAVIEFLDERGEPELDILLLDGFDGAFLGVVEQFNSKPVACYDRAKCIEILERQGMTNEQAEEYFTFNVEGAWVGEQTPYLLWHIPPKA